MRLHPAGPLPGLAAEYRYDFFVLAGDANRDRAVDFNDLVALAQHYNTTGGNTSADGRPGRSITAK